MEYRHSIRIIHFNPRSREGSDIVCSIKLSKSLIISIHAPARGATSKTSSRVRDNFISIHAPARGATLYESNSMSIFFNFNPRSREGSDGSFFDFMRLEVEFQSTLPRGERRNTSFNPSICLHFNPRSREGSDIVTALDSIADT